MSEASLRKALEDELAANPDDLATHAAYADLLSEQGDRRGEFIQVQIALEDPDLEEDRRQELQKRELDLLAGHAEEWLGALAPHLLWQEDIKFQFRRGWLDSLELPMITLELARAVRDAPQARLLRHLAIEDGSDDNAPEPDDEAAEDDYEGRGFWPLVGSTAVANLRSFRIGVDDGDAYEEFDCTLYTSAIVPLVRGMPRLEELYIFAESNDLADLFTLPTLRRLRVLKAHHANGVHRLDVLAANPAFGHLTHLLLHPHALEWNPVDEKTGFRREEGYLPLAVVRPLLHSPNLPHLTHLQLRLSSMGDEGCKELVESGILKRLKSLDLRHGRISDAGARLLANGRKGGPLEWLDLSYNSLSPAGLEVIRGLGMAGWNTNCQHEPSQADRMTGVEEYLGEGDFE
jgi:uncharacterized protein (TIGR02996 family)